MRLCSYLILICLCLSVVEARGRFYNHRSTIQTDHPDWMRWLPDELSLSQLSLAGTHDTMADKYGGPIQTQSLSLKAQLEAGIRFIDIRARHESDKFKMFHGISDLGYWFDEDVLSVCVDFLDDHPTETIVMKIGSAGVPSPEDVTRSYEETFRSYRDDPRFTSYFWKPEDPSVVSSLPRLEEIRGKIVVVQTFSSKERFGFDHAKLPFYRFSSWKVPSVFHIKAEWEERKEFLRKVDARHYGNWCYMTELNGSSLWAYPRTVSGGFLCLVRGINSRALRHIFEENHQHLGIVIMDFPGAGLIDAIIAKNMKNATSPSAVIPDFVHVWKNICYSAHKGGEERVSQLISYLNGILPSQNWGGIVSQKEWGVDLAEKTFFVVSENSGGYNHLAFTRNESDVFFPANFAKTVADVVHGIKGIAQERAKQVAKSIRARFPQHTWNVFVTKAPEGPSNWAFDVGGVYYKARIGEYAYLIWA